MQPPQTKMSRSALDHATVVTMVALPIVHLGTSPIVVEDPGGGGGGGQPT